MRFGIALPTTGALARPEAVAATARAAAALSYSCVWAEDLDQLVTVASSTPALLVGLLAPGTPDPVAALDLAMAARRRLGVRLVHTGLAPEALVAARGVLPADRLLDVGDAPPAPGSAAGWAPHWRESAVACPAKPAPPSDLLVLRVSAPLSPARLEAAWVAGADQVVVGLPEARTLDQLLAGFAEAAEQITGAGQPRA